MKVLAVCLLVAVAQASVLRNKRQTNVCADVDAMTVGLFEDPDNCAGYLMCAYSKPVKKCCPAGLQWDHALKTCNFKTTCAQTCAIQPYTTTPSPVQLEDGECILGNYIYRGLANPNMYQQTTLDRKTSYEVNCPAATPMWSDADCTCIPDKTVKAPALPPTCRLFEYENGFGTEGVWVAPSNPNVELRGGKACFSGGVVDIPYYDQNEFKHALTLQMDIVDDGTTGKATLVGNTAGFVLSMENQEVTAELFVGADQPCTATVKVSSTDNVKVVYDGAHLKLATYTGKTQVACTGDIERVAEPVHVGQGFAGCIDNLKICKSVEE